MIIFACIFRDKMKRYYYITIVAVVAIASLQLFYVTSLYNRYIDENIIRIDNGVRVSIDKEQHLRSICKDGKIPKQQQYLSIRVMDDVSPQKIDSLKYLSTEKGKNYYNIDTEREKGFAETSAELILQVLQDGLFEKGFPLDLKVLDSTFIADCSSLFPHTFILYNKDKEVSSSIGGLKSSTSDYTSKLIPIGTKGLQYLQIKANIPLLPFIKEQV